MTKVDTYMKASRDHQVAAILTIALHGLSAFPTKANAVTLVGREFSTNRVALAAMEEARRKGG
jgi:hypothetical protein